ncbi:MAG: hypothetical protein ABJB11_24720, partial [Ferruginibacter sp.]
MKTALPLLTITGKKRNHLFSLIRLIFNIMLCCVLVLGFSLELKAQTISNVVVTGTPVCAGSDVTVTFEAVNGTNPAPYYTTASEFEFYISDAFGGNFTLLPGGPFTFPLVTYNTSDGGATDLSKTFTLPSGLATGSGYRFSITTLSPPDVGTIASNASAPFTINAQVVPTVSIAANTGTTICSGTDVTFTASPTNGGVTPGYQWKLNGADLIGETNVTLIRNTLVNGDQITVILTPSAEVCANPTTATSNILTMTVNPLLTVSVNISASATTICEGTNVTFTAGVPTNGGLTPGYQWQLSTDGGVNYNDIAGQTSSIYNTNTLLDGYLVRLKFTSSENCASPNPIFTSGILINVSQTPTNSNAGPDQLSSATCGLTTVTLAGNAPSIGTGLWTIVSGAGGSF